jgi:hypothetical protein
MKLNSVTLEPILAAVQQMYSRDQIVARAEWMFDLDRMVVRLQRFILSERLADESVRWPTTWWDAFKERWFPNWALRRWPAAYSHADFTVYRGYPDLVMPERGHTLYIQRAWVDDA